MPRNDLAIAVETLRLEVRALVGIEAEPRHAVEDHTHRLFRGALAVGVLDAQDELAARAARVQPAESAVRTPPTCSSPVGLGAKRVTTVIGPYLGQRLAGRAY